MLDPQLIILDEPSMGLDPQTRGIVFETVALMNRPGPHDPARRAERARRALRMSTHGVVLENGPRPARRLRAARCSSTPRSAALYLGGSVSAPAAG